MNTTLGAIALVAALTVAALYGGTWVADAQNWWENRKSKIDELQAKVDELEAKKND